MMSLCHPRDAHGEEGESKRHGKELPCDILVAERYWSGSSRKEQGIGQEESASSCTRRGLDVAEEQFLPQRALKHWNRLLRTVLESPSVEGFTHHVAEALSDVGHCLGSAVVKVGLADLTGLFQPF